MSKITLSANIKVTGSTGNLKSLLIQSQYEFLSYQNKQITDAADDEDLGKWDKHYEIEIDSVTYWVPGKYCCEYDTEIIPKRPDLLPWLHYKGELERKKYGNESLEPNVVKLYKETLGRTILNQYKPDYAWWYKQAIKLGKFPDKPSKNE